MAPTSLLERVERLNRASAQRVIEPDVDLPGSVGDGQVIADELLSVHGLGLDLSPEQRRRLSREEVASMFDNGIRFEAVLEAGFALLIARSGDIDDPRITYYCHELGEETRHQRLFQRVRRQLGPTAVNPMVDHWFWSRLDRLGTSWLLGHPATLFVMVISGEEIPDLLQRTAAEHPDTDPFLAEVNRYHRQEEARHLSFARAMLPGFWRDAKALERWAVRHVVPLGIEQLFAFLVHPGVYTSVGLDGWATWRAANRTPERVDVRHRATRPVLAALLDGGLLRRGRVPRAWRRLCGVDRHGAPVAARAQT